jgi:hypothetical protein
MTRTEERRELLGIFTQLREAALATYPERLHAERVTPELHLDTRQWEEVRPTAEGLGFDMEITARFAIFTGRLAGTRVKFTATTVGCFDELAARVREQFAPAALPNLTTAPKRTVGNFTSAKQAQRTYQDALANLEQARKSGHLPLIRIMEDTLATVEKLVGWQQTNTTEMNLSIPERVAIAMCHAMQEALSPGELSKVIAVNSKRRAKGNIGHRCASTELMDTTATLDEVWTFVMGSACNFKDPAEAAQFDDAYTLARDADYNAAQVIKRALAAWTQLIPPSRTANPTPSSANRC